MVKAVVRVKPVAQVFRSSSEAEKKMRVQLARMSVLYEDLKIEWAGAEAEELKALEGTDATTRRFYFVRRTLATLMELNSVIKQLNANDAFDAAKKSFEDQDREGWDAAHRFFEEVTSS